jgi:hypothetical protein
MAIKTYRYVLQPPPPMFEEGAGPGQGPIATPVTSGRLAPGRPGASPTTDMQFDEAYKDRCDAYMLKYGWTFLEEIT